MKLSHKETIIESKAVAQLCSYLDNRSESWKAEEGLPDLEMFEKELHECMMEIERELVAQELSRYDIKAEAVEVEGTIDKWEMSSPETYHSAAGEIRVERQLYRPAGRSTKSICPMEMRSGIVMGVMTPRAARQSAYAMAHLPTATVGELFKEIGNMEPSRSTLGKLPAELSQRSCG